MPVFQVLDVGEVLAFERLGDEGGGLVFGASGHMESFDQLFDVVSINDNGVPAKGLETLLVDVHLVAEGSWLGLAKTVDVEDGTQVVQLVVAGEVDGFPD